MSYENLLTDTCDIYHLKKQATSKGWGIPEEDTQKEYFYDDVPDHKDVESYFVESNQTVIQSEPNQVITEVYKVHFLKSTDIRINDKIVWGGASYKARKPRLIKNHHIEVIVTRSDNL